MKCKKESLQKRRGFAFPSPNPALLRALPRAAQVPISSPSCTPCCSGCDGRAPPHPEQPRLHRGGSEKLRGAAEDLSSSRCPTGRRRPLRRWRPAGKSPAAAPGWGPGMSHPPPEELSKKACSLLSGLSREGEKAHARKSPIVAFKCFTAQTAFDTPWLGSRRHPEPFDSTSEEAFLSAPLWAAWKWPAAAAAAPAHPPHMNSAPTAEV